MTKILSEEKLRECFLATNTREPLEEGWPGLERFARAIEAAILKQVEEAQAKQEPMAWCVAYDDPRMGRIHSNPTMCEPEVDAHVSKCGGVVVKVPLFAAPVVRPGMVMVPREPTEAMLHEGLKACLDLGFSVATTVRLEIYRAMIAAAEGEK